MRISDWSSDVCSSDLAGLAGPRASERRDVAPAVTGALCAARQQLDALAKLLRRQRRRRAVRQRRLAARRADGRGPGPRSEEHTYELQSLMRISYAVFCLKKTQPSI